ncbi:MAG: SDR family NAD(P)-dependent oxidoreductase [Desulfamplus sp.]|nr:SDR family NAD(P)-dependent oxidoreductase [Desulfamplus sp.]
MDNCESDSSICMGNSVLSDIDSPATSTSSYDQNVIRPPAEPAFDPVKSRNRIQSRRDSIALELESQFHKNKINTKIIYIDEALETDLSDMAGLVIIPSIFVSISSYAETCSSPIRTGLSAVALLPENITGRSKAFLKKAFLLAKKSGQYLVKAASEKNTDPATGLTTGFEKTDSNSITGFATGSEKIDSAGAFFAAISFLGGTFGFGDEIILDPVQGGLAGLLKTAALEWKGVLCRSIDMPLYSFSTPSSDDVEKAAYLILTPAASTYSTEYTEYEERNSILSNAVEIGIKDGCFVIPELIKKPLDSSCFTTKDINNKNRISCCFNHEDVIVITGGARGVTAECAIELALYCSPIIILMGRSPLPEPEPLWIKGLVSEADIKKAILANLFKDNFPTPMELQKICSQMVANREIIQNLEKIKSSGSIVKYYSVDIRNMSDVIAVIEDVRKSFGKPSAIVHGAGILEDKSITDKTEQQFSSVFDTKINGMENLLNATVNDDLKYVIFFSSVAARTGNAGQVDYAMANEVLNKTAQYYSKNRDNNACNSNSINQQTTNKQNNNCRFLSINWGPWEGGMVSDDLKNAFKKRGIELIPLKSGAQGFVDELAVLCKKPYVSPDIEVILGASLLTDSHLDYRKKNPKNACIKNKSCTDNNTVKDINITSINKTTRISDVLFNREKILAFAIGKPSEAFGELYIEFDNKRQIARLPGPPYFFMDRVNKADAKPWKMVPGGWIECQYDVPYDAWYFKAGHTNYLPFCILLEIALQPCGWLAAYAGSALKSQERLFFRNLGGEAEIFKPLDRTQYIKTIQKQDKELTSSDKYDFITLTMRARITSVSHAGGIIIQNFDMEVLKDEDYIYKGKTSFGFFNRQSLSNQTGIKKSELHYIPSQDEINKFDIKQENHQNSVKTPMAPYLFQDHQPLTPDDPEEDTEITLTGGMPSKAIRMVDNIDLFLPEGGKYGKGFIKGSKNVNPEEWFFKAHFYQDPVCPGSLGVESFLQIIKFYTLEKWNYDPSIFELALTPHKHKWIYRGQIIPSCSKIEVFVHIKEIKINTEYLKNIDKIKEFSGYQYNTIIADGLLYVDGLCIYQMENFSMALMKR